MLRSDNIQSLETPWLLVFLTLFWKSFLIWKNMVLSWNYLVPTWNHMAPIKPVNLYFLILKYLRIGFSKKRFHIQHHKNMLIVSSTLKSSKIPTFFLEVEPYSSKLELCSSKLELYSSNLELYGSIWVY